jgi:hypothetical protein
MTTERASARAVGNTRIRVTYSQRTRKVRRADELRPS